MESVVEIQVQAPEAGVMESVESRLGSTSSGWHVIPLIARVHTDPYIILDSRARAVPIIDPYSCQSERASSFRDDALVIRRGLDWRSRTGGVKMLQSEPLVRVRTTESRSCVRGCGMGTRLAQMTRDGANERS